MANVDGQAHANAFVPRPFLHSPTQEVRQDSEIVSIVILRGRLAVSMNDVSVIAALTQVAPSMPISRPASMRLAPMHSSGNTVLALRGNYGRVQNNCLIRFMRSGYLGYIVTLHALCWALLKNALQKLQKLQDTKSNSRDSKFSKTRGLWVKGRSWHPSLNLS